MNYSNAIEFINYTNTLGIVPGLDSIKELLRRLDNPQDKLNVIHVAGTNGKGSICAYLEYGYRECGIKVGRYISPTLFSYLERFQINGNVISEADFTDIIEKVKDVCDQMTREGHNHPTSFEVETAVAFLYFLKENVEIVLLETGMGGREDATNVVSSPLATVFATISFDHMGFLGETIEEIAANKAGIMRKDVPVIASYMPLLSYNGKEVCAKDTIICEAKRIGAPLYFADVEKELSFLNPLQGEFQKINISTALLTFDITNVKIRKKYPEKEISKELFIKGLTKTKWPGRYETVKEEPLVIRDGAHNSDAARLLYESVINDDRINGKIHLIMGCFKDKTYKDVLKIMLPLAKSFTAVTTTNPQRALQAKDLCAQAMRTADNLNLDIPCLYEDSVLSAYEALNLDKSEVVLIFGSLSLMSLCEELKEGK